MKQNIKLKYSPNLSVKENAFNCNVSESCIRKYIRENLIDRKLDNKIIKLELIKSLIEKDKNISLKALSSQTSLSVNTVKKYRKLIEDKNSISKTDNNLVSSFDLSSSLRIIKTVSNSQFEILTNILLLHIKHKHFDCDLTASVLGFYKCGIPIPTHLFDMFPCSPNVKHLDEIKQVNSGVFKSIIFDLPFIIQAPYNDMSIEKSSIMDKRFSSFPSIEELYNANDYMITESFRLLVKNGILIIKTMDIASGGKQYWVSNYVQNKCIEIGFELIDTFILVANKKVLTTKIKAQKYARKYHSYFFVFKKKGID